ncbi:hypothetical protein [Burkholderia multivorans]|uniref:hypothetical protein n=1 Tax=Burkholderia multivorans TaxID=87883 RepID=UPI0004F69194|nr:hypothetical protein [Burkholderia multivorans]AIO75042.1 hypothetical protein DM80_1881 [Burkholderia multivorans]MBU9390352.1 hypothetical protein [Burkholderia multivorans]MBU9608422.1 hypothetical protein [Burkholderia multivorans]MBU9626290.1 hypothetical protein [Burkholderia multivorans]
MISNFNHASCQVGNTAGSTALTGPRTLTAEECAAVSGAWNWGGMVLGGLQQSVAGGIGGALAGAATGQPIGMMGIQGMIIGVVGGGLHGGLQPPANRQKATG